MQRYDARRTAAIVSEKSFDRFPHFSTHRAQSVDSAPLPSAPLQQFPLPQPLFPPHLHTPRSVTLSRIRAHARTFSPFSLATFCHILPHSANLSNCVVKKFGTLYTKHYICIQIQRQGHGCTHVSPSSPRRSPPTNDSSPLTPTTHRKARCSLVVHFRGKAAPRAHAHRFAHGNAKQLHPCPHRQALSHTFPQPSKHYPSTRSRPALRQP